MSPFQWIGAILALGVLIIVHESGHYLVARWCKMRVERFSLGFGPAILKWKRGETQFQIAPIPLGGFVQITGMNPHEEFDPQDPNVYPNRPTWQRFLTIFAGPFTNLLFSIVLIFIVFAFAGMPTTPRYAVDSIQPPTAGKPVAAQGILQAGDRILAFNDKQLYATSEKNGLTSRLQESKDQQVKLTVLREGRTLDVMITPQFDEKDKVYRLGIGIAPARDWQRVGVGTAAVEAVKFPWIKSAEMLGNLVDIARRKAPVDVRGPVGITKMIAQTFGMDWVIVLEFLAFLNVALGLFNLLPVPALDGGRLAFLGYELVTRRRPNPRIEAAIHMVGFVALMLLIVVVTIRGN